MNLVNVIKDQFSSQMLDKLAALTGGDEQQTKSALGAIVPALLSAFSKMSAGSGAEKIAAALNQFDSDAVSKMSQMVTQDSEQALEKGNDLIGSLFGSSTVSGLATALSKFAGLDSGSLKKLLAYVSPLVMGAIAKQFQGKPATPQGLRSLFDDQRANIAQAMPAGLSLASIPGISEVSETAGAVAGAARQTAAAAEQAGSSAMKTLLPLGALALLALLVWNFLGRGANEDADQQVAQVSQDDTALQDDTAQQEDPAQQVTTQKPVMDDADDPADSAADTSASPASDAPAAKLPDVTQITADLNTFYTNATRTLSGITDLKSAEEAIPQLKTMGEKVEHIAAMQQQLPAVARTGIAKLAGENIGKLTELIEKVLAIPGVGEKLKPILDPMMTRLKTFMPETSAPAQTPAPSQTP